MPAASRTTFRSLVLLALAAGLVAAAASSSSNPASHLDAALPFVHEDGSLHLSPRDIEGLVHLGSWFVPSGAAAGFHHVYTKRESITAYRETGRFPDGTVLVKEIVSHRRANYTTGADVASATETQQWFVMVKDASNRFSGNPLWGDGWGWGLFLADAPSKNVATDYHLDCLGCHTPAQSTDWVYTGGYPALEKP